MEFINQGLDVFWYLPDGMYCGSSYDISELNTLGCGNTLFLFYLRFLVKARYLYVVCAGIECRNKYYFFYQLIRFLKIEVCATINLSCGAVITGSL